MSKMPERVQLRRTKGWRMPPNTVKVSRPGKWGNPFTVDGYYDAGYSGSLTVARRACVDEFRGWLTQTRSSWGGSIPPLHLHYPGDAKGTTRTPPDVSSLRGKNLACWCPLDQPCHADVLLELANRQ